MFDFHVYQVKKSHPSIIVWYLDCKMKSMKDENKTLPAASHQTNPPSCTILTLFQDPARKDSVEELEALYLKEHNFYHQR